MGSKNAFREILEARVFRDFLEFFLAFLYFLVEFLEVLVGLLDLGAKVVSYLQDCLYLFGSSDVTPPSKSGIFQAKSLDLQRLRAYIPSKE